MSPTKMDEKGYRDDKGRFVEGWKGGPGRPKFSIVRILREKLQGVPEGEQRPLIEALMDEYIADARERRDGTAIRDMIDRFDGKPKQHIDIQDDRVEAWHGLLRDTFVDSEPSTEGDS